MTTLVLDATNKTIVAVMSGAATTTNPSFVASYADNNGTTFAEGANSGSLSGATPVTLVSAPASGYRRVIKKLYIENADTAAVTVTIYYNNNGTNSNIAKVTLNVGDTWTTDGTFDTYGSLKQTLGTVNLATGVTGTLGVSNGGTGATTLTGLVKGNGTSAFTAATAGTDYAAATTGTNTQLLANNGSGGFTNVTVAGSLTYSGGTLTGTGVTTGKSIAMAMIFGG